MRYKARSTLMKPEGSSSNSGGKGGISLLCLPLRLPHSQGVTGPALPYFCSQGWLTHAPATKASSTLLPGQEPTLPGATTMERWVQLFRVPHPVRCGASYAPWMFTWFPAAVPTKDIPKFSTSLVVIQTMDIDTDHCIDSDMALSSSSAWNLTMVPGDGVGHSQQITSLPTQVSHYISLQNAQPAPLLVLSHMTTTYSHCGIYHCRLAM